MRLASALLAPAGSTSIAHLVRPTDQQEARVLRARLREGADIPYEEAVIIFNKLKAWHYSGHFHSLVDSIRTQSDLLSEQGTEAIADMLAEIGTSQDELFETQVLVDELVASQQYATAIELAKQGEQPFLSMNLLLKQGKTGIAQEQERRDK